MLPHEEDCPHMEKGWCLDCVKDMHDRYEALIKRMFEVQIDPKKKRTTKKKVTKKTTKKSE